MLYEATEFDMIGGPSTVGTVEGRAKVISKMLHSKNAALHARALEYIELGTDAVGTNVVKATTRSQGELYAIQLVQGIEKSKRVGFDPFSTLLKGSVISDGTASDISIAAEGFGSFIQRTLIGMDIIADDGNITDFARKLFSVEQLKEISDEYKLAGELVKGAQEAAEGHGSRSVVLRHQLLEQYGLPEGRRYGTLADEAQKIQEVINKHMNTMDASASRAIIEMDDIRGVIGSGDAKRINSYIDDLFASSMEEGTTIGEELSKYNKLREIFDSLDAEDSIKASKHGEKINSLNSILNMNIELGAKSMVRKDYAHVLDTISAELVTLQDNLGAKIVGDLQNIADSVDGGMMTAFTHLQLLIAKQREMSSTALDLKSPSSQSRLGLKHVLDQVLGDGAAGYTLRLNGMDYALSDIASLAKNTTSIHLLEQSPGIKTTLDEVIGFLRSQSDTLTPETNVLGKEYLDEFLSYSIGRKYALKETGRLGSVPKFIDKYFADTLR